MMRTDRGTTPDDAPPRSRQGSREQVVRAEAEHSHYAEGIKFDEGTSGYDNDVAGVVDGIEIARNIARNLEGAQVTRELIPGAEVADRDQIAQFVRNEAWGHHACGTARIGRDDDPDAVVDGDFRVRGVSGLRVVDASIFPDIPGFFIASAVYLVSEKASDVLIAEYGDRSEGGSGTA